jgi:hypothetical protein
VLERWGLRELKLLRNPPSYLRLAWHNAHSRVFAVEGSEPLVRGPGRLLRMTAGEVAVRALGPGPIRVHVHYTRFLHATGPACLSDGPGGWTILNTRARRGRHPRPVEPQRSIWRVGRVRPDTR